MKKCTNCGMVNEDYANYCNYCGMKFHSETNENKSFEHDTIDNSFEYKHSQYAEGDENKLIILGYITSIILSWGWVPLVLLKSIMNVGFVSLVGLFLPFYMINSENSKVRKHGYFQFIICILGCILGIYFMFHQ
ncbi:zinc ribbon domain-containing protein [uncultured Methanobrevibacter sp.]|uniref:zinc ribbon domain-containing protein n=1 Tax=uncultured Methanobrevibacter sp. TaxID=253161 RepID=UPI0025D6C682|nr:zinc ribbon domain-containing protein [uncultured Methanobrevibacter sp.]